MINVCDHHTGRARLIPVLISAAIILMCAGIFAPGVIYLRQKARLATCQNNMKQISIASISYHDVLSMFPSATMPSDTLAFEKRLSWLFSIMPYIESSDFYYRADKDKTWDDEKNVYSTQFSYRSYSCGYERNGKNNSLNTSYLGIGGVGSDSATYPLNHPDAGIFGFNRKVKETDLESTSQTLMILETNTGGPWAQGGYSTVRGIGPETSFGIIQPFGSNHSRGGIFESHVGANCAFADGSVRFLKHTIDPKVLESLARIRGDKKDIVIE